MALSGCLRRSGVFSRRLQAGWKIGRPFLRSGDGSDLSRIHGPGLSGLFESNASQEAWESYALSEAQLMEFQERGYLSGIRILSDEACDALAADVKSLLVQKHPAQHLWYAYHPMVASGAWRISFNFHDLCWAPQFRIAAHQLLGGPVRFLHDQIFCKPPSSRQTSWFGFHQDFSYWSWTSPMAHLTCWIALDDATAANGCLKYVPGSHRWGLIPPIPGDTAPSIDAVKSVLSAEQQRAVDTAESVELKKGFACFHHPLILHGSDTNTTSRPRRAAVINTIRDGVLSNCGLQPASLGSFPFIPQGMPMGRSGHEHDRMYPLLLGGGASAPACEHSRGPGSEVLEKLPRLTW